MHILLTTHQFLPDFETGTELLALWVARELKTRGHTVCIYTGLPSRGRDSSGSQFDEYEIEGVRVYRFHHSSHPSDGERSRIESDYDNRTAAAYFSDLLESSRPDVVHFFHLGRLGSGLIPVAVRAGLSAFLTATDYWSICPTGQMLLASGARCDGPTRLGGNCIIHFAATRFGGLRGGWISRIPSFAGDLLALATGSGDVLRYPYHNEVRGMSKRLEVNVKRLNMLKGIIVPTRAVERALIKYGVNPVRLKYCTYGIEPFQMPCLGRDLPSTSQLRIGYIGTLGPHKGCHILIEAFRRLPVGTAVLRVYGRESDFPAYAAEVRRLSGADPAVLFCGSFPNSRIGEVFAEIDVLAVPSLWSENAPLVVYAAQAACCPVLGSNVQGIAELVCDGNDGLLFEPGDIGALTDRIRGLASNPEQLRRLRKGCKKPKTIAEHVDDLIAVWSE